MTTLIIIGIPLISLILAILPFWYVKKKYQPNIKWRHLGAAFLVTIGLLVGFTFLVFGFDKIFKNTSLNDTFLQSFPLSLLVLSMLLIISPFFVYRLKYVQRTKKGYFIITIISIGMFFLVIALWLFLLTLSIAQFQNLG